MVYRRLNAEGRAHSSQHCWVTASGPISGAALENLDGDNPRHDQFETETEYFETLSFETSLHMPPSM
jgi:hypothetical protein